MDPDVIPSGLTPQEYSDTQIRLAAVESVLQNRLGADNSFCKQYFEAQVGSCTLIGGACRKHVPNQPPLPPGLMCSREYGVRLSNICTAMEEKRQAKLTCKRAFDALKEEELSQQELKDTASGFLNSPKPPLQNDSGGAGATDSSSDQVLPCDIFFPSISLWG
jgi:hypothetical protein